MQFKKKAVDEKRMIEYPQVPFKEIPNVRIYLRGTSTQFSQEGGLNMQIGSDKRLGHEVYRERIPFYFIPPASLSFEEWKTRFEATCHAAVERALHHANLIYTYSFARPKHLPVLVAFSSSENSKIKTVDPHRKRYEFALVKGKPVRTFTETEETEHTLRPYIKYALGKCVRVALTRLEYAEIIKRANLILKQTLKEIIYNCTESDIKCNFDKSTENLTEKIFGYPHPKPLEETGRHAENCYTYLVGELVKEVLLRKLYTALENTISKPVK